MSKFKKVVSKTWMFGTAAAIIVGSNSAMAFVLNQNANVYAATTRSVATTHAETASHPPQISGGYTVIDESKKLQPSQPPSGFVNKLSNQGLTTQQIDQKWREVIASSTPGAKDMSAQQAAAYAAAILQNAYGVSLKGYTADATFQNPQVPDASQWEVIFHAPNEVNSTERYLCSINSVTGTILDAGAYNLSYNKELSTNLGDSSWVATAKQDLLKLLPDGVSITSSKVVASNEYGGVSVVSNLSNGAAFTVRLSGANKFADAYQYFPSGYDGSWNTTPVTANGVG